ncbi:MAG: hypothetical protein IPO50_15955 [Sphingomonadales bacterium]|nr:hypothetical protein [Sphingomonadales bacterium]
MPYGGAAHQLMLAVVGMSLIGAAGYTMRTLPRCHWLYRHHFCRFDGSTLARALWFAIATCILILATSLLLCRMALTAYSLFVVRIVRERERMPRSKPRRCCSMILRTRVPTGCSRLIETDG